MNMCMYKQLSISAFIFYLSIHTYASDSKGAEMEEISNICYMRNYEYEKKLKTILLERRLRKFFF